MKSPDMPETISGWRRRGRHSRRWRRGAPRARSDYYALIGRAWKRVGADQPLAERARQRLPVYVWVSSDFFGTSVRAVTPNDSRRTVLKRLAGGVAALLLVPGCQEASNAPNPSEQDIQRARARMKAAEEEEAKDVKRLFSTKPVRVRMRSREYVIPVNYFGPKGKNEPDTFDAKENGFGFFLFLPDFGGYTKENWRDPFDHRRVSVLQVSTVDKNAIVAVSGGGSQKVQPENYGEPKARFENLKGILEDTPSYDLYGLKGYRSRGGGTDKIVWTGSRSNGEFFFFESHVAPGQPLQAPFTNPLCSSRYYSENEDLFVAYHYSQDHLMKWREIDDAIWSKLHQWQLK